MSRSLWITAVLHGRSSKRSKRFSWSISGFSPTSTDRGRLSPPCSLLVCSLFKLFFNCALPFPHFWGLASLASLPLSLLLSADLPHPLRTPTPLPGTQYFQFTLLLSNLPLHSSSALRHCLPQSSSASCPPVAVGFSQQWIQIFFFSTHSVTQTVLQRSWTLALGGHGPLRLSCFSVLSNLNQIIQSPLQPLNFCGHLLMTRPSKSSVLTQGNN